MSTIRLDISAIGTGNQGTATIGFNDGSVVSDLKLISIDGTSVSGFFSRIPTNLPTDPDSAQAQSYAQAFNRDFRNVGGNNNLLATIENGSEVVITSINGQFSTFSFDGIWVANLGINNDPFVSPLVLNIVRNPTVGNCDNIQYSATLSGGSPNYTLVNGSTTLESAWDGSSTTFDLNRGTLNTITAKDTDGTEKSIVVNVPRKLKVGEFKESFIQYEGYSDVSIASVNPVSGTTPIEYALTALGEATGSNYQSSNNFPGVFVGQYLLWVKDVYGCEVSKVIEVRELEDNSVTDIEDFFLIPEANAIIFSQKVEFGGDVRKNYFNTTTRNERSIGKRHQITQSWLPTQTVPTRFLSSYPFHIVTLTRCNGTKQNISIATVQENLGAKEKLDCVLFNVNGVIGVYFNGGNEYQPDTDTVIGANDIDGSTPDWGNIGQLVFIDGVGGKYITGQGYDENRGYYFTVEGTTTDDLVSKVQTIYNKHNYNVFDFFLFIGDIQKTAKVEVQYGYDFNNIVGTEISEVIEKIEDSEDWHLIKWGDEKNKGDMIYQSFPQPFIMLKGKLDILTPNSSDTSRGDSRSYSLDQESFLGFRFRTGKASSKLVNKLTIASGTGFFEIDGIRLVKVSESTFENFGNTNLKTWTSDFDYGGNQLGIKEDEFDILDISTGVVGGGNTAKGGSVPALGEAPVFDGKTRYVDSDGNFFAIDGGIVGVD